MDYRDNLETFYKRSDYAEITGLFSGDVRTVQFKAVPYIPRKTKSVSADKTHLVWEELKNADHTASDSCLYLHIPFCNLRCTYCGFYKDRAQDDLIEEYSQRLVKEIILWKEKDIFQNRTVRAVFFGGGTPSVLTPQQIQKIISVIRKTTVLSEDCEITFESSIHDMDEEKFTACLAAGVNRFSFGIQTFDTTLRRSVGRPDSKETICRQLESFTHSNARIIIDLIYGLPGQTAQGLLEDLRIAKECGISGLDLYKLHILPGSPLGKAVEEGRMKYSFTTSQLADMFARGARLLKEQGYRQISCCHWAADPAEESRYNTMVKAGDDIIACGCSCGGALGPYKLMKLRGIVPYMNAVDEGKIPVMAFRKQSDDYRLVGALNGQIDRGVLDFAELNKLHPIPLAKLLKPVMDKWVEGGLLLPDGETYAVTTEGAFWYKDMARTLLIMAETALFGEITQSEISNDSMMGMARMNNLK